MNCTKCGTSISGNLRFCTNCGNPLSAHSDTPYSAISTPLSPSPSPTPHSLIGLSIDNKYRIEQLLGAGGMGAVFRANRLLIGDSVALKVINPDQMTDANAVERFRREAQAAARLKHPNAVSIYDFGVSSQGLVFLVMELVEGQSLRQIISQQGPLTPSAVVEILQQVCGALDEAHKQLIIHRDIKPDNILVKFSNSGVHVKVLDFGIAKLRDLAVSATNLTQTGSVVGTPHYMSPEQCLGEELDQRSDIYSLGIVLYECLTGMVPFNSPNSAAIVVQQVTQSPPSMRAINISISAAVEAVVLQALEKRREARPASASLLAQQLKNAVNGIPQFIGHSGVGAYQSDTPQEMANTVQMPAAFQIGSNLQAPDYSLPGYGLPANAPPSSGHFTKGLLAFAIFTFMGLILVSYLYFFRKESGGNSPDITDSTARKSIEQRKSAQSTETQRQIANHSIPPVVSKPIPIESSSVTEEVKATLDGWAATTRSHDFDTHMTYYADILEIYYSRQNVSVSFVRSNRSRAFKLYSSLDIQLSNIKVTPDSSGLRATTIFDKYYNFQNGEKSFSGSVQQMIWLAKINESWRIIGEKDLRVY
jgi:serine/threonine protein kinase